MPRHYTTLYKPGRGTASPALYLVFPAHGGEAVGMLEKYRDTRTDKHPWKAFAGFGLNRQYLGAFYPADGGKESAIAAIENKYPN